MAKRRETYKAARERLLSELETHGWQVSAELKVPHATSPDGELRVWFRSEGTHLSEGRHELGNARSLYLDRRGLTSTLLLGMLADWYPRTRVGLASARQSAANAQRSIP